MTQANVLPSDRVALEPCPFCGGVASFEHLENGRWSVGCNDAVGECMAFQTLQTFARQAEARAAWNTRARHRDASVRELVEALEKCRDQFAFYASEHLGAGKFDKAATNKRFADLATAALASAGAQPDRGHDALERSPAQFFFEVGYGAAYAEATLHNDLKPPFELTDAIVERAWSIAGEAHDDPAEFDSYLARANGAQP